MYLFIYLFGNIFSRLSLTFIVSFVCICNNLDDLIMVYVRISEILHFFPVFIHRKNIKIAFIVLKLWNLEFLFV